MSDSKLVAMEKLIAENSRLHKEIQELRTPGNVDAYTPYRDAGFVLDLLKSIGICAKKPNATLLDAAKETTLILMEMQQYSDQARKEISSYKTKEDAITKLAFGQDCEEAVKAFPHVRQIAKLRATLELVKVRLEQFEKNNYNEEISQLHFDLERFLSTEVSE